MATSVNKMTNSNVYINGTSLLGKVMEATLPEVEQKMITHNALGMVGSVDLPSGIEPLEMEIKWSSYYADTMKEVANPSKALNMQIRGNLEVFGAGGITSEVAYVATITGTPKNFPLGNFKHQENSEFTSKFTVTAAKIEVAGVAVFEIDILANIWKIDGKDVLSTFRNNIGG